MAREFTEKQRLEIGSLSSEFNILVLISTFTSALIISFLSFSQNIIVNARNSRPFQFGMFFSIISIGFHLFAALLAARAGMICFRISKSLDIQVAPVGALDSQTVEEQPNVNDVDDRLKCPTHTSYDGRLDMPDFQRFIVLCEQLQLMGTALYFPSALFLIFYIFERMEFAIAIYALTGVGTWAIYSLGFWKVSVLWHDLSHACSRCKAMVLGIGKSK